ncbi:hypothetical protein EZ313_02345 [Ramlibacter henchirensis]|uniref:DUF2778 domain-containing protein n=1 Tax=Ramlibacter henchirensis TaxID=204072 RepID=A0A4Z0C3W5_9BURK|nr:hypothetical protein [Ramlibacter henchirensis]TFZ05534.1 hypothetical protein EZ313_02345 [Ramlibacter henchirensis]
MKEDNMKRPQRIYWWTLIAWLVGVLIHLVWYVLQMRDQPPTDEVYTRLLSCQVAAFALTELPYWLGGAGRNNPAAQHLPNLGPIPTGKWEWGTTYNSRNTGMNTINLVPLPGNSCHGTGRDCDSFRAHGNNRANDASRGCIILPPNRTQIPQGEIVEVMP